MDEDLFDSMNPIAIPRKKDLLIKKDYARTLQIIYRWRNFLFVVITLCLLLLQMSFLLVHYGYVVPGENDSIKVLRDVIGTEKKPAIFTERGLEEEPKVRELSNSEIKFEHVTLVVNITNTMLIFASVLYAFVMFCGLGVSLGGDIGGLVNISRACIYSLIIIILLLPWQIVFKYIVLGAVYTPRELAMWHITNVTDMLGKVLLYLRFIGYPILVFILLILAQLRSLLWSKTVIRKLEQ